MRPDDDCQQREEELWMIDDVQRNIDHDRDDDLQAEDDPELNPQPSPYHLPPRDRLGRRITREAPRRDHEDDGER